MHNCRGKSTHMVNPVHLVETHGLACHNKFIIRNCGENQSVELIGFPHNYELRILNYEFYSLSI